MLSYIHKIFPQNEGKMAWIILTDGKGSVCRTDGNLYTTIIPDKKPKEYIITIYFISLIDGKYIPIYKNDNRGIVFYRMEDAKKFAQIELSKIGLGVLNTLF